MFPFFGGSVNCGKMVFFVGFFVFLAIFENLRRDGHFTQRFLKNKKEEDDDDEEKDEEDEEEQGWRRNNKDVTEEE